MSQGRCKFCDTPIVWAKTQAGKTMPVDPGPADNGNLVMHTGDDGQPAVRQATDADRAAKLPLYVSHFATCSNAAGFRKSEPKKVKCPNCGHRFPALERQPV